MSQPFAAERPASGEDIHAPAAGWAVAIGSAGVFATSLAYALAPPLAALPAPSALWVGAHAATRVGCGSLWWVGTLGPAFDAILAAGAMLHALELVTGPTRRRDRGTALGWILVSLACALFIAVDALAGRALPALAARDDALTAYLGVRAVFDMLFIVGTLTFGLGSACASLGMDRGLLRAAVRLTAAGAVLGSLGMLVGVPWGLVLGLSVAAGALLFTAIGLRLVRVGRS